MSEPFYIEVGSFQKSHVGERICGDVFVSQRVKEENRTVAVLSDGMGHGVKANLLATLTATMTLNFTKEHKDARKIAEIILNTLPICSERKISYATFSIVDVDDQGQTTILNYDNPRPIITREGELLEPKWIKLKIETTNTNANEIEASTFLAQKEDRVVLISDGVAQSGLGKGKYLLGFGIDNVRKLVLDNISENPAISASKLSQKLVNRAFANDGYQAKDDTSAAVIYFRHPRQLLVCSGPPFDKEKDPQLAGMVRNFEGKKIICGGSTADIIARELDLKIEDNLQFDDPDLPPISIMERADLVTEGILTLSKVSAILEGFSSKTELGNGPADMIIKHFLDSDEIIFWVGTAINVAHQDPNLPVELEIRRSVIKKIANILENKLMKEVKVNFI